ncbi:MAG TPA: hypothetical protein VFA43_15000 [Gemmatimonadaceae bacterium]|nr:hypothetical protein [Gemmatimonadaceae bacterium]
MKFDARVTERLNAVYADLESKADRAILAAQRERLQRDAGPAGW